MNNRVWGKRAAACLLAAILGSCPAARAADPPALALRAELQGLPAYGMEGDSLVARLNVSGGTGPFELTVSAKGASSAVPVGGETSPVIAVWPLEPDACEMDLIVRDSAEGEVSLHLRLPVADTGPVPLIDMVVTGDRSVDLLIAALSELGYAAEKTADGLVYNKYAAWAGDPFGDGELPFLFYCLESAGIGEDVLPRGADIGEWVEALGDLYIPAEGYEPLHGDLVFFCDATGALRHAGIVAHVWDQEISAVRWIDGAVADVSMQRSDYRIAGYVSPASAEVQASDPDAGADPGSEAEQPYGDPPPRFEAGTYETASELTLLRSAPGSDSPVVGLVEGAGTPVEVTGYAVRTEGVSWYLCRCGNQSGVARGDALGIPEPPFPHYGKTLGWDVTVRSALDTESEPLMVCGEPGTELQVTDRLKGPDKYVWFEVVADGQIGYIRGDMFEPYALTAEQLAEEQAEPSREFIIRTENGVVAVVTDP